MDSCPLSIPHGDPPENDPEGISQQVFLRREQRKTTLNLPDPKTSMIMRSRYDHIPFPVSPSNQSMMFLRATIHGGNPPPLICMYHPPPPPRYVSSPLILLLPPPQIFSYISPPPLQPQIFLISLKSTDIVTNIQQHFGFAYSQDSELEGKEGDSEDKVVMNSLFPGRN